MVEATLVERIEAVYDDLDAATAAFAAATGITCPPGCGACCVNPDVEATPLQLVPLAAALLGRADLDAWLERIEAGRGGRCVVYRPEADDERRGSCGEYRYRPVVCRAFGFAAVDDKQGHPRLAVCRTHRATQPAAVEAAERAIAGGLPVPVFADWAHAVAAVDPGWSNTPLPLNEALAAALGRLGLARGLGGS